MCGLWSLHEAADTACWMCGLWSMQLAQDYCNYSICEIRWTATQTYQKSLTMSNFEPVISPCCSSLSSVVCDPVFCTADRLKLDDDGLWRADDVLVNWWLAPNPTLDPVQHSNTQLSIHIHAIHAYTLCSKKSDAKIQITVTTAHLIRINYPLSSFNYRLSGTNSANFNKIHHMVSEQQLFKKWNLKT